MSRRQERPLEEVPHSTLIVRAVNLAPNRPCVTLEPTAQPASLHPACNLSLAKAVLRKPT